MTTTTELTIGTSVHVHMGRSDYDGEIIDAWQPNGAASAYYDVRDDKTGRIIFGVAGHQIGEAS